MDKSSLSTRGSREGHLWETYETPFLVTGPEGMMKGKFECKFEKIVSGELLAGVKATEWELDS